MPKITYVYSDGTERILDLEAGRTLMEGAVTNGITGILGECGGSCACGTCMVYVDEQWQAQTGKASDMEEAILDGHNSIAPNSRLSCQIEVTPVLDGLVVCMPESQF